MTKISLIGAGSVVFAKQLITDILSYSQLRDSTISLMDIDEDRLELIENFTSRLIEEMTDELFQAQKEYLPSGRYE